MEENRNKADKVATARDRKRWRLSNGRDGQNEKGANELQP